VGERILAPAAGERVGGVLSRDGKRREQRDGKEQSFHDGLRYYPNGWAWDNVVVSDEPRRRQHLTTRRFASNADAARADDEYWRGLSQSDRVLLAWQLSVEQWRLAEPASDERRLSRSIARLLRR